VFATHSEELRYGSVSSVEFKVSLGCGAVLLPLSSNAVSGQLETSNAIWVYGNEENRRGECRGFVRNDCDSSDPINAELKHLGLPDCCQRRQVHLSGNDRHCW
jgi:hypothetical protein